LEWHLLRGSKLKEIRTQAKKGAEWACRLLEEQPLPYTHNTLIWEAFQKLNTCRSQGLQGNGPIPWTAINEYAIRKGIYGHKFDRFEHLLEVMDGVFLSFEATKRRTGDKRGRVRGK
jgi:hypothetical protein